MSSITHVTTARAGRFRHGVAGLGDDRTPNDAMETIMPRQPVTMRALAYWATYSMPATRNRAA